MKKILVFSIFICALCLWGADEVFTVTGTGSSPKIAIREALISALEQKCGVTISASERSLLSSEENFQTENGKESQKTTSADHLSGEVRTLSKGRINGYSELSRVYDPASKNYTVTLQVRVQGKYAVGLDPDNRRRMAVGNFYADRQNVNVYGQSISTTAWLRQFSDALTVQLTQSRKFTMLDRDFDADVNSELSRLSGSNAAPADIIRLNQKLGTDYLVVGTVAFTDTAQPEINPFTGQPMPLASAVFATIHCRVLLAPTGQLKWADTIQLDALHYVQNISASAVAGAEIIAAALLENILPFEIVAHAADNTIVIGEGGKSLYPGEFLSVYALGEEVRDSRTGEVLDFIESRLGMVQVIRVTPKLSYAAVVDGAPDAMKIGSRLRRDHFSRQAAEAAAAHTQPTPEPAPTTVQSSGTGGVVVPF